MRRAIAVAVMGGLVLAGAVATPSLAAAHQAAPPAKPRDAGKPKAAGQPATVMKTVVYGGYQFQVPASWPVYRLDEHPQTCVRYDVHAVYLGKPGPDMRCAAGLVGQTETVSFIPGPGTAAGAAGGFRHPAAPEAAGGTELRRLTAVHGTMTESTVKHKLQVTLGAPPGATVVGTYGTDPAVAEQVLKTLHLAPAGTAPTAQSSPVPSQPAGTRSRAAMSSERAPLDPLRTSAAAARGARHLRPRRPRSSSRRRRRRSPSRSPSPPKPKPSPPKPKPPRRSRSPSPPKPKPTPPVKGFDTCTAPSLPAMRAWHSAYAAVGVYIGGANSACAAGNLSASWVRTVTGMGWGLLPTYVGPQAPCWGSRGVLIKPGSAAAEGKAAAADAVSDAKAVGLAAGSPIYYDMEAYKGGASCKSAVLNFLGAWDRQVAAAGYVTGVYSSQASGIVDMQAAAVSKTPGFTPPDAVWIALWDNVSSLSDGNLTWPLTDRNKQYEGNVNQTIGRITLDIDKDLVGGPVARGPVGGLPPGSRGAGN